MTASPSTGFSAAPTAGPGHPVLVLHPWWGLNDDVRAYCARLAAAGFAVQAPDLYAGRLATTIAEAEALSGALDGDQAKAQVAAAVRTLAGAAGSGAPVSIAVLGFSLGAYFALDVSTTLPNLVRAVVLYYGTGPGDFAAAQATYLGHFAAADPYEPAEAVDWLQAALTAAGRPATFHRYPATGHWFAEPGRPDAYDPIAAELAWTRTVMFLKGVFGEG